MAAAGLIGSSLMGAAAVMGGAMDSLVAGNSNNSVQDATRRASAPVSNTGFSSIFNLKSVISAASKAPQNPTPPAVAPTTSNFYVSSPAVAEPINVEMHSHSNATVPQKTVQGIVLSVEASISFTCCNGLVIFLFFYFLYLFFVDEILF